MLTPPRVLLVEDEQDIANMLRLFFNWSGYELFHAAYGEQALRLASEMMPHVILMDISLPDTDGYTLTTRLRKRPRTAHIPILFLTKWNTREHRHAAFALGADDYISKPFNLKELMLRTQNCIARAAHDHLTDLRTGLPGAFTVRDRLEATRNDPEQAIIELTLEHAIPYRNVYGTSASALVIQAVGQLVLASAIQKGDSEGFIGYLDEDHFMLLTTRTLARPMAEQIAAGFNDRVSEYYSESDRQRGHVLVDGIPYPFMRLHCRITIGTERIELT